jgi:hypothetical protein
MMEALFTHPGRILEPKTGRKRRFPKPKVAGSIPVVRSQTFGLLERNRGGVWPASKRNRTSSEPCEEMRAYAGGCEGRR